MKQFLKFFPALLMYCFLSVQFHGQSFNNFSISKITQGDELSQENNYHIRFFTQNDGLPSNHIYETVEDHLGFLWIATDNGIARFDGKYLTKYSVKDGLPSNDVLNVKIDGKNIIWVNCYKQLPAYFDEKRGRFVTVSNNPLLSKMSKSYICFEVRNDGILRLRNPYGSILFSGTRVIDANRNSFSHEPYFITEDQQKFKVNFINSFSKNTKRFTSKGILIKNNAKIDSINFKNLFTVIGNNGNSIFAINKKTLYRFSRFRLKHFRLVTDSLQINDEIIWNDMNDNTIRIIDKKNTLYELDANNMQIKKKLHISQNISTFYKDRRGAFWLATLNEGLICYQPGSIQLLHPSIALRNNGFLSISIADNGKVSAGNYYGEIMNHFGNRTSLDILPKANNRLWIRKIISTPFGIYAITDKGLYKNAKYYIQILNKKKNDITSVKTACKISDSIIFLGTINGLASYNVLTGEQKNLQSADDRILGITKVNDKEIYYLGPKGLYYYNIPKDKSTLIMLNGNKNPDSNFMAVHYAQYDGTLWVATSTGDFCVLKKNKQIAYLKNEIGIPENINQIISFGNRIWIASKTGICILEYGKNINKTVQVTNIFKVDGLPSEYVTELALSKQGVFAATQEGIAIVPVNFKKKSFNIKTYLAGISINQKPVPVQSEYNLKSNERFISLTLSGIDLTGHFKNFLYNLDNSTEFIPLQGNVLNLELSSGKHIVYVKAQDINKNTTNQVYLTHFNVKTPVYQTFWFWAGIGGLFFGGIVFAYSRRKLLRQQRKFQQTRILEQQRNKITADLHDDIGATLSSLQINSAIANSLIEKERISDAQNVLKNIESQSQKLSENIGNIVWSLKPNKEALMTLSTRIKNFANEILGNTNINYEIIIDEIVDKEITDFSMKKNIVLIVKEALNNSAKYSNANQLKLTFTKKGAGFFIEIYDDGKGFDIASTKGNGLNNMRKRTEEMLGDFEISVRNGTCIKISIPDIRD